jgi:hypothetical protein
MGDEIRITVIATGFEDTTKKKQATANVTHLSGIRREDLSIPTFMRNESSQAFMRGEKRGADGGRVVTMNINDETANVDIDIPTFLRRQAD